MINWIFLFCECSYHLAEKNIPSIHGHTMGYKLEQFIFDAFPYAPSTALFEVHILLHVANLCLLVPLKKKEREKRSCPNDNNFGWYRHYVKKNLHQSKMPMDQTSTPRTVPDCSSYAFMLGGWSLLVASWLIRFLSMQPVLISFPSEMLLLLVRSSRFVSMNDFPY